MCVERSVYREQEGGQESELNREMKMALLLLSEQQNGENLTIRLSKKKINDTVVLLQDRDDHNSIISVSHFVAIILDTKIIK